MAAKVLTKPTIPPSNTMLEVLLSCMSQNISDNKTVNFKRYFKDLTTYFILTTTINH